MTHSWRQRFTLRARVHLLIGVLVALVIGTAAGTFALRQQAEAAVTELTTVIAPAQTAATGLTTAYVEQANGVRGFLLTDDPSFLQSYTAGQANVARFQAIVSQQLATDPTSMRLLVLVDEAARMWRHQSVQPELDAAQRVPGPHPLSPADSLADKQRFDTLRARLNDLDSHINQIAAHETAQAASARTTANWVTGTTSLIAIIAAVGAVILLRRSFTTPLNRLVSDVDKVAAGDLNHPVRPVDPAELAKVADAVETMRVRILDETSRTAEVQQDIARHEEAERIALGLHDQVIQRLVGSTLMLQQVSLRHLDTKKDVSEALGHIDRAIRELRTVIFNLTTAQPDSSGLRQRVLDLADDNESTLGFPPMVHFNGPIDTHVPDAVANELLAGIEESLSNITRHAHASSAELRLTATDHDLTLRISDNGQGMPPTTTTPGDGLKNLHHRAERLGGTCTIESTNGEGTTVHWQVPLNSTRTQTL